MNNFLNHNDVITGFSTRDEASLNGMNKIVEKGLETKN